MARQTTARMERPPPGRDGSPSLLIVDDDRALLTRLSRAMEARGFRVVGAGSADEGLIAFASAAPDYAIVELRLGDGNGLELLEKFIAGHPAMRALVLTGYGSIASAVAAIKSGACDYLTKPADADEIEVALRGITQEKPALPTELMSADRVRWEHIQRVYEMCGRNVSETARRLHMHRRTLQRILAKRAPK